MIKPIFENFRSVVQNQLEQSQKEILVAVAWFTDDYLYRTLCERLKKGTQISVLIMDDDINRQYLDWSLFKQLGGNLIMVSEMQLGGLMHNKFCVIDSRIVMSGSYNWTKRANNSNQENLIMSDEPLLALEYEEKFRELWLRFSNEKQPAGDAIFQSDKFSRRLELLRQFTLLEEYEDARDQLQKLQDLAITASQSINEAFQELVNAYERGDWFQVVEQTDAIRASLSQLATYHDLEVLQLEWEISYLERQIELMQEALVEAEALVESFRRFWHSKLGELAFQLLKLEAELAQLMAKLSGKKEDFEKAEQQQQTKENFHQHQKEIFDSKPKDLSQQEEDELKQLYRSCSKQVHPDKILADSPELAKKAEELMQEVNLAKKSKDIEKMRLLHKSIQTGEWKKQAATAKIESKKSKDDLTRQLLMLKSNYSSLSQTLKQILETKDYQRAEKKEDWDLFIEEDEKNLLFKIKDVSQQIQQISA